MVFGVIDSIAFCGIGNATAIAVSGVGGVLDIVGGRGFARSCIDD